MYLFYVFNDMNLRPLVFQILHDDTLCDAIEYKANIGIYTGNQMHPKVLG